MKTPEALTAEQVAAARRYANSELERCSTELDDHLGAVAHAMARNDTPVATKGVDKVRELQTQVATLRAVMPKFDALDAQLERERSVVLARDRLVELEEREIPAAVVALEAAEKEPKPESRGGLGLRAVEAFFENINGRRANLQQLQSERDELEGRVALLHR